MCVDDLQWRCSLDHRRPIKVENCFRPVITGHVIRRMRSANFTIKMDYADYCFSFTRHMIKLEAYSSRSAGLRTRNRNKEQGTLNKA